jgi:Flp pilus assembly pilin Flp
MRTKGRILHEERGASAVEFALTAPVLFGFIVGIAQLGTLFFANAGLKSAVEEAARYATIHPRPSIEKIEQRIIEGEFGLDEDFVTEPVVTTGKVGTRDYVTIEMQYYVPLDFIFYRTDPIILSESRRVFVQPQLAATPPPSSPPPAPPPPPPPACKAKKKC